MSFLEIVSMASEISKSENKGGFDIDKRVEISSTHEVRSEGKFDIDKRAEGPQNRDVDDKSTTADIQNETSKVDDNGNVYRIENELLPNNTYEINGYKYVTDEYGRIISAEGVLQKKDHEGKLPIVDSMSDIGKGDQKPTDDRGHLIGDQFNGSPGLENLVPQDAVINQKEVKALECSLANEVKKGSEVYLKVEPHYSGDSHRPDSFTYTYTIDGETSVKIFRNGGENG